MEFYPHHICIKVSDMERSENFYKTALGFQKGAVIRHTPEAVSDFIVSGDGTLQIQLLKMKDAVPEHMPYGHLGMRVENMEESYAFHKSMGCLSSGIVEQTHQFGYFIKDPDGYEIELIQLKE